MSSILTLGGHEQVEIIDRELDVKPINQAHKGLTVIRGYCGQWSRIEA